MRVVPIAVCVVCVACAAWGPGCTPDTDLTNERARPGGSGGVAGFTDPEPSATPDTTPPALADIQLAFGAGCLSLTMTADEPVMIEALVRVGEDTTTLALGAGAGNVDLAAPARAVPPDSDGDVTIRAVDRAGNASLSDPVTVHTPPALPPVAITEVLANPAGAEPDQEFVELHNLGDATVGLAGLRIEDSRGGDVLPAVDLPSGAYALVVGPGFDAFTVIDVPPRPGAILVRLESRI
ncbi:MAG TPA: lamin tail domain-containing protein, partial [Polyangia bacterium]|nr:lamin tail domain-containing protein [Polyangia bacterium]